MSSSPDGRSSTFLHPVSGLLILGLDWLLFSGSVVTLGLSTPALAVLGFGLGGLGTGIVQWVYRGDSGGMTLLKSVLAGITVGIPLPVAGTAIGGGVLALSGLNALWDRSAPGKMTPPSPESD